MFDGVTNMRWVLPIYAKILNMAKFWIYKVLKMRKLHSVQNISEYALNELWIYIVF